MMTLSLVSTRLPSLIKQRYSCRIIKSYLHCRKCSSSVPPRISSNAILFLSSTSWPEPNATAAGTRTASLLNHFAANHQLFGSVHFGCGAPFKHQQQSSDFLSDVHLHHVKPNRTNEMAKLLHHIQTEYGPISAVIFDRFYAEEAYSFHIREACPHAIRILDMQDVHSLRIGRQHLVHEMDKNDTTKKGNGKRMTSQLIDEVMNFDPSTYPWAGNSAKDSQSRQVKKAYDIFLRELGSIHRSDLILVCSSSEMDMLQQPSWNIPHWKLVPASFFQNTPTTEGMQQQHQQEEATHTYKDRCDFITVGGFKHPPNVDSIRLLKHTLWPRIRSYLPTARLHVYGAYPTNEILSMHNIDEGFFVHGHVDDATLSQALMESRVCLAPLRFGAGIKGKIVDSWGCGLPVVTTPIGAEGMFTSDGGQSRQNDSDDWGGYIASNDEEFVEASVRLYTSNELWSRSQRKGVELFNTLFNKEHNLSVIDEAIHNTMMNLHQRRRQDITGQLLWHQSNRSTEYFSKWIQLKEKGPNDNSLDKC